MKSVQSYLFVWSANDIDSHGSSIKHIIIGLLEGVINSAMDQLFIQSICVWNLGIEKLSYTLLE